MVIPCSELPSLKGGRLSDRQDGPSVDSNGSQASDNPSDLSLSCSSSPFESYRGSDESGAEGSVTVEPYMYEPPASSMLL